MASVLFQGHPALPSGPWDEPLHWLGVVGDGIPDQVEQPSPTPPITLFVDGGYAVLRTVTSSWAVFRLPNYRFRPAHADPLHFDLWYQGVNLLRDGGSYAYNASPADLAVFPGIASHNTVQFDSAEPMPRIGRFGATGCSWRGRPRSSQTPSSPPIAAPMVAISVRFRWMRAAIVGRSPTPVQISKATCCCAGGFVLGLAFERIFPDWTDGHIANPLRSAHLTSGVGNWVGVSPLRSQNKPPSSGGDIVTPAILTTFIQLSADIYLVKVLITTRSSTPAGAAGTRSCALARSLVEAAIRFRWCASEMPAPTPV